MPGKDNVRIFLFVLWLGLTVYFISGCEDTFGPKQTTTIDLVTQHHDEIIPNIDIYVKYFTTDFPGFDNLETFDTILISNAAGRATLRNFPLGQHWFVGIGFDEKIKEQVYGAMDITFNLRNLTVDTILYVGEE
jgi:hypothetical protein